MRQLARDESHAETSKEPLAGVGGLLVNVKLRVALGTAPGYYQRTDGMRRAGPGTCKFSTVSFTFAHQVPPMMCTLLL